MAATKEMKLAIDPREAPRRRASGATARVVDELRQAILNLELEPGANLDKAQLTRRFGVSRFPIAEALNRLKIEGLVEVRPQSGSKVARIRLSDARENMFLRRALEGEAVAHHARQHTEQLLVDLTRNLRYQKVALEADDRAGFHKLDLEFHDILISSVGYPRVRAIAEGARLSLDRARRLLIAPTRHALNFKEHSAIVASISHGDAQSARVAMAAHLNSVMGELEDFARENPTLFCDTETGIETTDADRSS
jgi:GntR family transcriptional regulator, rspAB operon transcriptional repressor